MAGYSVLAVSSMAGKRTGRLEERRGGGMITDAEIRRCWAMLGD